VSSGGIFADIAEGFQAIFLAMAIGIVLVYLVMVASLGSLRNPFVIVTTLPLALIGVLVALAITGRPLGLPAMMGILLLIGIVVTNAIVLIAFVEQQRANGMSPYDAIISGARVRLRPILMTALTTSFALLPLALETEGGGLISGELATVVIGGLVSSTALTLVVLPIVYMLFNDSIPRFLRRLSQVGPFEPTRAPAPEPAPTAD
jgi:HAE1 family hydrophobic/amphiphilic exporter-1